MDDKFIIIHDNDIRPLMVHYGGTKYALHKDVVITAKRCGMKLLTIAIHSKQDQTKDNVVFHILHKIHMERLATKFLLFGTMFNSDRPLSSIYKLNLTCGEFNTLFHLVMSSFKDRHELLEALSVETENGELDEAFYLEFANMLKEHYDVIAEAKTRI